MSDLETPSSPHERMELIFHLSAPAIEQATRALRPPAGSRGLDAGCGAGCHADLLLRHVGPSGSVTGLDLSDENLAWARGHHGTTGSVEWVRGDIGKLPFADACFDWVWCADTLWPGAVVGDPAGVLAEFTRVTKPEGGVALLYWSSQTLLPGHAALEARLNAAFVETVPYLAGVRPELHFLRAETWLRAAGLHRAEAGTFVAQIAGPVDPLTRRALATCYSMFWEHLAGKVSGADWSDYRRLCDPASPDFVADVPGYYAFLTYTMFWARRPGL